MLTLQFIPYYELQNLTQAQRISKFLRSVRDNKIVLVEGKLDPQEEALLIEKTMEEINKNFKGVEICSVDSMMDADLLKKIRTRYFLLEHSYQNQNLHI